MVTQNHLVIPAAVLEKFRFPQEGCQPATRLRLVNLLWAEEEKQKHAAEEMQVTSTFWVVTQPLPTAEKSTISQMKEERQGFHMNPKIWHIWSHLVTKIEVILPN